MACAIVPFYSFFFVCLFCFYSLGICLYIKTLRYVSKNVRAVSVLVLNDLIVIYDSQSSSYFPKYQKVLTF